MIEEIQKELDNSLIEVFYLDSTILSLKEDRDFIFKHLKYNSEDMILIFINFKISFEQILNNHEKRYFSILEKLKQKDSLEWRKKIPYISKEKLFKLYSDVVFVTKEEVENYSFKDVFIFNIEG